MGGIDRHKGGNFMIVVTPNEWNNEQDQSAIILELNIPIDLGNKKQEG